ncbi:MAG: hypothetical protein NWP31_03885 [Solirubrobacteraceae bacterium]|nr:hypothetical protein [Solirubrobacteraceae bacterium]MDP4672333.1 hypothetical protein [Solirubrobacteraceae bacterium]MDP4920482.1 hypothetical protein [Solirubrobacteraceae bacterium]MDP5034067.1 hypothetical protein [Solirubrobacteraceae bacterium]
MAKEELIDSISDSQLYSIGAFFCDEHPELVEDVLEQSVEIERDGLARWAKKQKVDESVALQTLITGLSVRFYTALAGGA